MLVLHDVAPETWPDYQPFVEAVDALGDVVHPRAARLGAFPHDVEQVRVVEFALGQEQVLRVHGLELGQQAPGLGLAQVVRHEAAFAVVGPAQA